MADPFYRHGGGCSAQGRAEEGQVVDPHVLVIYNLRLKPVNWP